MAINRLLEIVYLLLEKDKVTAGELAERFQVSKRTIYRDIEELSAANIPVYADRGKGGGIKLLPGFTLSKSMLTEREQDQVLSALQTMRATGGDQADGALLKLSALFGRQQANWVDVDFNDWSGRDYGFDLIKIGILEHRQVEFSYFNSLGQFTSRMVEPLQLWFKHRDWYLKAYCLMKQDYRVFKCVRMKHVKLTDTRFERTWPENLDPFPKAITSTMPEVEFTLKIDASEGYRVYDMFDNEQVTLATDGSFIVNAHYIEDEWVYGMILGFGEHAQILEPARLRQIIIERLQKSLDRYI